MGFTTFVTRDLSRVCVSDHTNHIMNRIQNGEAYQLLHLKEKTRDNVSPELVAGFCDPVSA